MAGINKKPQKVSLRAVLSADDIIKGLLYGLRPIVLTRMMSTDGVLNKGTEEVIMYLMELEGSMEQIPLLSR